MLSYTVSVYRESPVTNYSGISRSQLSSLPDTDDIQSIQTTQMTVSEQNNKKCVYLGTFYSSPKKEKDMTRL